MDEATRDNGVENEIEAGDVIVTMCPSGMCAMFGRENHQYTVLEPDPILGHTVSGIRNFLPMKDRLLVAGDKVWTERGTLELIEIKKGAGAETLAQYQEFLANVAWANENGITGERYSELCESEEPLLRMVSTLVASTEIPTNTSNAAIIFKLAGIDADERQKLILAVALSALLRPYQDELAKRDAEGLVASLFGGGMGVMGPLPDSLLGLLGDLLLSRSSSDGEDTETDTSSPDKDDSGEAQAS